MVTALHWVQLTRSAFERRFALHSPQCHVGATVRCGSEATPPGLKMERASKHAAKLIDDLSALTKRLGERDIQIALLRTEYSGSGGWIFVATRNQEAVRFPWAGRYGFRTFEGSPMEGNTSPSEWTKEVVREFDVVSGDDPVLFVEPYLRLRFPV